jgi:hypothetical protein
MYGHFCGCTSTQVLWLLVRAGTVNALSFSADQQLLFSASSDSTVRLWSTELRKGLAAFRYGGNRLAVIQEYLMADSTSWSVFAVVNWMQWGAVSCARAWPVTGVTAVPRASVCAVVLDPLAECIDNHQLDNCCCAIRQGAAKQSKNMAADKCDAPCLHGPCVCEGWPCGCKAVLTVS